MTPVLPSARDWWFSLRTFAASMLALYIALALSLPNPVWAMGTVYVVSQPMMGAMRSKTLYRVGGTLLGVSVAVLLVPPLSDTPILLMLATALWSGTMLYVSMLDRTPRNYLFRLPAYTMPLVALPALHAPQSVFEIALARSEEIIVGIVCANVVAGLAMGERVTPVIRQRLEQWFAAVSSWAAEALSAKVSQASRHPLTAGLQAFEQLIAHLAFDTGNQYAVRAARELRARMRMLMPHISSLAALQEALARLGGASEAQRQRTEEVSRWLMASADSVEHARYPSVSPRLSATATWPELLEWTLRMRLVGLVELWRDCQLLRRGVENDDALPRWQPAYRRWNLSGISHHIDFGMLLFYAGSMSLGIFLGGLVWLSTGWAPGANALVLGTVACSLFASLDEPAPQMFRFLLVNLASSLLGGLLLFVVLPSAHEFETLVACFFVPCLLFGVLLVSRPQFGTEALLMIVFTGSFVGLRGAYTADFQLFLDSCLASALGALGALLWTLLMRPFGSELALSRLVHANWRDLAHCSEGGQGSHYPESMARMQDRLELLLPRLANQRGQTATDAFRDLRVGFSVLHLQREEQRLGGEVEQTIARLLAAIAAHFRACEAADAYQTPDAALLAHIDQGLRQVLPLAGPAADEVRNALVELRVTLFPEAAEPDLSGTESGAWP